MKEACYNRVMVKKIGRQRHTANHTANHTTNHTARKFYQRSEFYLLVALFIFTAILSTRLLGRSDLGYQIKFAELVLAGHIPQTEPFTFSVPNNAYICLNFFYDVLSLGLYKLGSYELLSLYTPACMLILVGILVYFYYRPSYKIELPQQERSAIDRGRGKPRRAIASYRRSSAGKVWVANQKWLTAPRRRSSVNKVLTAIQKLMTAFRRHSSVGKILAASQKWWASFWQEIAADPLAQKISRFFSCLKAPKISTTTQISPEPLIFLVTLLLLILSPRIDHASELLALIAALIILVLNQRFLATGRYRYLAFLPLVQLLWVNSHASFMIGWAISGACFLTDWQRTKKIDWRYVGIGVAMVAVSLINPYTWRGAIFPFSIMGWFGLTPTNNLVNTTISEYLPFVDYAKMIFFQGTSSSGYLGLWLLMIYIGVVLVIYWLNWRQIPLYHWLILITLLTLTWMGNRTYVFLVVLTVLPLAEILNAYWQKVNWPKKRGLKFSLRASWIILLIYLSFLIISGRYYGLNYVRFGIGVHDDYMPVEGTNFIVEHGLKGNIYNDDLYGGWLVWHQDNPVYIMGHWEVMGNKLMKEQSRAAAGQLAQILTKYDVKMVFLRLDRSPEYQSLLQQALASKNFKLVEVDKVIALWVRDDLATETGLETFDWGKMVTELAPRQSDDFDEAKILALLNKKYKYQQLTSAHRYFYDYGKYYNWGDLAYLAGENEAAKTWLLNYLTEMVDYDFLAYEHLYQIFLAEGNEKLAQATLTAMAENK